MLESLRIKNIALIDQLEVSFADGLNVLTGETGAGKSVVIGAVGIALGGRFDRTVSGRWERIHLNNAARLSFQYRRIIRIWL